MRQYDQRNLFMVMDFYEMTMSNGYFNSDNADTRVAFDVFYRKNPDNGGFAIFAGLEQIIEYRFALHCISYPDDFKRNAFSADLNLSVTKSPIFKTKGSKEAASVILKFIA